MKMGGYTKEWHWDADTALMYIARCATSQHPRANFPRNLGDEHIKIFSYLLSMGANVHHRSCTREDKHETVETILKPEWAQFEARRAEAGAEGQDIVFAHRLDALENPYLSEAEKCAPQSLLARWPAASHCCLSLLQEGTGQADGNDAATT